MASCGKRATDTFRGGVYKLFDKFKRLRLSSSVCLKLFVGLPELKYSRVQNVSVKFVKN